ncbi:Hypoxanthine-guanine phosphoribosyltransferase [Lunatimonas lonarensis]|uniref:Hypoxanthine phosphoribosyltransferase n=1 Tax=Lunatimonas lonarensis TaxID=1232681 RepID=R7ZUJ8_9BACT|nr:hypoxanthine phosphoribosyltransferase [Lunatimonas lonarensis]EON77757.1 Hypoxanthine-guanine phosphoribosyltransferase [Lunatimonas lonarensis]
MIQVLDRNFVPLISASEIQLRVDEIADKINLEYISEPPVLLGVLNGAFMFFSDLVKRLQIPVQVAFIRISSYEGLNSSGNVATEIELRDDLTGRRVIVIEDIVDTGRSMEYLVKVLESKGVKDIALVALLHKPDALQVPTVKLDHIGFSIKNKFVVGYGLDYAGFGRNLPEIYVLEE